MTQIIEPNEKSDLTQDSVRRWISQAFTGIASGFDVSQGSSGFLVNISSGTAWVNGVYVDDDETRLDLSLLTTTPPAGGDEHWVIYGQHTPAATFPPPPMVISAVSTTPPAVPTLPADSVKIADIFVPAGANDITDCTIVKAPKLPARGANDGDAVVERLLNSNMNVLFGGGGTFTYDGGAGTLTWTEDITLIATTITNKEKFASVPLAALTIPADTLGPSPAVGDNSILFAVFDRLSPQDPSSPPTGSMRVLNLDAPDATEANAFYDPVREKIVFIGAIFGGELRFRSGISNPLPAPVAQTNYFLRNDPSGNHYWSAVTEDLVVSILAISALSVTSGNPVEIGDNVVNPTFSATTVNDGGDGPDTAVLTNDDNVESKNVQPDFSATSTGAFQSDQSYQKSSPSANGAVVFTLTADDGDTPDARNTTLNWYRRHYYGVTDNASPDLSDDDFLKTDDDGSGAGSGLDAVALVQNPLRAGKGVTIDVNPVNQYVYFAFPSRHGTVASIIDNNTNFDVTSAFTSVGTITGVATENAAAVGEQYIVYRSNNLQNGNVNITVS